MLRALKTATEAHLEISIKAAEFSFPFPASDEDFEAARSAFSSLSLQVPMSRQPPAGILAARANGIGKSCNLYGCVTTDQEAPHRGWEPDDDNAAQLFLATDYTDAALTVLLVHEDCFCFEDRRVLHDTTLGADALHRTTLDAHQGNLVRALRNITTLPLEDGNGEELDHISNLVLLGERASDRTLHGALRTIFQDDHRYLDKHILTALQDAYDTNTVNPLFAASVGLAEDCWDRLNYSERNIDRLGL
ncbi:MAG: hypothetical protein Q9160_002039 [Pyrenula sp. 1 TL-2023]